MRTWIEPATSIREAFRRCLSRDNSSDTKLCCYVNKITSRNPNGFVLVYDIRLQQFSIERHGTYSVYCF